MFSRRHFLSLIAALSLSTLAAANSIPTDAPLQSATGIHYHFSPSRANFAALPFDVFSNHDMTAESHDSILTKTIANRAMPFDSYSVRHRVPQYIRWKSGPGTTAPEPGSLMLLSTGLLGLSGLLRRKLHRA